MKKLEGKFAVVTGSARGSIFESTEGRAVLRDERERWCDWVKKLLEARAAEIVTRGGAGPGGKSRFEMLINSKEHYMHHRAKLMVIERLLGIVPHLTRNRQGPQESAQRSTT